MKDSYRIDSHKFIYHPGRVHQWLSGELVYPIYVEVSPTSACNHRCKFCGFQYRGHEEVDIPRIAGEKAISEMGRCVIRSVLFAGAGEPFLHEDIECLINTAFSQGLDVAAATNGSLFSAYKILRYLKWVKFSIDAGTPKTHSKIHCTHDDDFERVLRNLALSCQWRTRYDRHVTIGTQMILLPDNRHEALLLAGKVRDIGVDYLVIKPYTQHGMCPETEYTGVEYEGLDELEAELMDLSTDSFSVIFRSNTMADLQKERAYGACLSGHFWAYLDETGNLWACIDHVGDVQFLYGNVFDSSFSEVWHSDQRRAVIEMMESMDLSECRRGCRMDKVNKYLWELKHPGGHVNFI